MAKNGKTIHPPNGSQPPKNLSPEMEAAIDLLLLGKSDREVAESEGVQKSRSTVQAWKSRHPVFMAELNRRRREVWEASSDMMRDLIPKAVRVLATALESKEDGLKAAISILKMAHLALYPHGETESEQIVTTMAKKRKEDEFADWGSGLSWQKKEILAELQQDEDSDAA